MNHEVKMEVMKITDLAARVILLRERLELGIACGTGSRECNAACDEMIDDLGRLLDDLTRSEMSENDRGRTMWSANRALRYIGRAGWRRRDLRANLLNEASETLRGLQDQLLNLALSDLDPAAKTILEMMMREHRSQSLHPVIVNSTQLNLDHDETEEEAS